MNKPWEVVDTFYLFDFDRCLGDTEKISQLLYAVVEQLTSIAHTELIKMHDAAKREGESLDAIVAVERLLQGRGKVAAWPTIRRELIKRALGVHLLEPGAAELLQDFNHRNIPYGIMTYGGRRWQQVKLCMTQLDRVPSIITNKKYKGRVIASWRTSNDLFTLPPRLGRERRAKEIVLVDDKAASFTGLPAGARGYWIKNAQQQPNQQGRVPSTVRSIPTLHHLLSFE